MGRTVLSKSGTQPTRQAHLLQALYIALALLVAIPCFYAFIQPGGSPLLALLADILLIFACGRPILEVLNVMSAIVGAGEGILVIFGLLLIIVLIPLMAPLFLAWNLWRAWRVGA